MTCEELMDAVDRLVQDPTNAEVAAVVCHLEDCDACQAMLASIPELGEADKPMQELADLLVARLFEAKKHDSELG